MFSTKKKLCCIHKASGFFRHFSALSFAINGFLGYVELLLQNHWVETIFYVFQTLSMLLPEALEWQQKVANSQLSICNDELFVNIFLGLNFSNFFTPSKIQMAFWCFISTLC